MGAIANLIAHQLFLSTEDKDRLLSACLLHHHPEEILGSNRTEVADGVRAILAASLGQDMGKTDDRTLASILRLANAVDETIQSQQFPRVDVTEITSGLRQGVGKGWWPRRVLEAFQECTRPVTMPPPLEWRVPVFPQAAVRTLEAMRNPSVSVPQVVDAARRDPATAGCIMHLANSALYSERGEVATLQMAVARVGFEIACKVVATLAMRPLLFLPHLEDLWPHSIEVADLSEQLARRSVGVDPAEAYLAGLLHDVGRIALRATTLYNAARLEGLVESGCSPVYAEDLILPMNHAGLGAQIARMWKLPERLVAAIQHHHRPEAASGPLPGLVYLAEQLAGSDEDLPSEARLHLALVQTGLTERDMQGCERSGVGNWLAAA